MSLGCAAGVFGGLLGIGGGALIVPGLVFFLGFDQHRAHGTSLLSALLLATSGVVTYSSEGCIRWQAHWPIALEIILGGVLGAIVGACVAGATKASSLRRLFSIFVVVVGAKMIWGACQGSPGATTYVVNHVANPHAAVVFALGLLTGFLSALFGIGGGMLMVPGLVILLCARQQLAQGLSLAAMIPTALTGVLMHRRMGNVDPRAGGWVGLGAAAGAVAGSSWAARLDTHTLQLMFGVFLFLIAALMLAKKQADLDG